MRRGLRRTVSALLAIAAVAAVGVHVANPDWYARLRHPLDYADTVTTQAALNHLPPDLLAAVIDQESGFDPDARSSQGAVGMMQVMPATARWIATQPGSPSMPPERLSEPEVNIAYGAWYLHYLIDKYGDERIAIAAYNGGETNVARWAQTARAEGRRLELSEIPFSETRQFVSQVDAKRAIYRRAYARELRIVP